MHTMMFKLFLAQNHVFLVLALCPRNVSLLLILDTLILLSHPYIKASPSSKQSAALI